MTKLFKIQVNTPSGIYFEDDILSAEINTETGRLVILANHAPVIGSFKPSHFYIRDQKNNRVDTIINYGVFRFDNNVLYLFTDFFTFANKINEDVFEKRQEQINLVLKEQKLHNENYTYDKVEKQLFDNLNELKKLSRNK